MNFPYHNSPYTVLTDLFSLRLFSHGNQPVVSGLVPLGKPELMPMQQINMAKLPSSSRAHSVYFWVLLLLWVFLSFDLLNSDVNQNMDHGGIAGIAATIQWQTANAFSGQAVRCAKCFWRTRCNVRVSTIAGGYRLWDYALAFRRMWTRWIKRVSPKTQKPGGQRTPRLSCGWYLHRWVDESTLCRFIQWSTLHIFTSYFDVFCHSVKRPSDISDMNHLSHLSWSWWFDTWS